MAALGLRQTVMTVRWLPSAPLTIQDQPLLDRAVPPRTPRARSSSRVYRAAAELDADGGDAVGVRRLARQVARTLPERQAVRRRQRAEPAALLAAAVRASGQQVSAAAFGPFLAAGYDALKAVDPAITVVGVGLSPRGNDRPAATSNVSTSPVRFLARSAPWYRASGRDLPLMDGLSFHPYPNANTDPLDAATPGRTPAS